MSEEFQDLANEYSLIRLKGKEAIEKGWQKYCTEKRAYEEIGFKKGDNAGIACGPASRVLAIDVDDLDLFQKTRDSHGWGLPETRNHETGRGNWHYLYEYPQNGRRYGSKHNIRKKFGFEVIGMGGYIVAPGSVHPDTGAPYRVMNDLPIAKAPDWLLALYETVGGNREADGESPPINIQNPLAGFAEGERDDGLFRYACELRSKGLSKAEGEILVGHSAKNCQPPFPEAEAKEKVTSAWNYGPGVHKHYIEELNEKHAVIMVGGHCVVMNETVDPTFNRKYITFSSFSDFRNRYANKLVVNPDGGQGKKKRVSHAEVWWNDPNRREYEGLIFSPGKDVEGYYNLWRGFAVKPKKGNCSLLLRHILEIIANGNKDLFRWVLAWMARIVRDPGGERPGTSIVLRGRQGVGKGCFARIFGSLFGNHFLHITSQRQLTGHFNNHLKDALVVFVDEGFWAGDKSAEGVLKGMITEDSLMIEPKGKDVFPVKNHINLIIASNSDWVVPAGLDERRFLVLDVSDERAQDHEYFKAIHDQMDNGGREAMLYDLLHAEKLSDVDLRTCPRTEALMDQITRTMNPVQKFWYERLKEGGLRRSHDEWRDRVETQILYNDYIEFANQLGDKYKKTKVEFSKELRRLCPGISNTRPRHDGDRIPMLRFPSLRECRKQFESLVKMEINWD